MSDALPPSLTVSMERVRSRAGVKWTRDDGDTLAAWVADMDFDPPEVVTDALREMVAAGDLGYRRANERAEEAFVEWQARQHGWRPDVERVRTFTSALHGLETVIWNTTDRGDGVVVFTPVYHPFLHAIRDSGRQRVDVHLDPDGWRIDRDRLEAAIDDRTRIILFCQPQNPTGRVFDADEIAAVADVADRHDLLVISDEIWGDFAFDRPHVPLAIADERFLGRLVTIGSASKSFNLAGLRCGLLHIDHEPTSAAIAEMPGHLLGASGTLGLVGTAAAWEHGEPWLVAVRDQLIERRSQLTTRLAAELPDVGFDPPEATYLAWLDMRATGLGDTPAERLRDEFGLALSEGGNFGDQAAGYVRLNFATTEAILDVVIDRLVDAVKQTR